MLGGLDGHDLVIMPTVEADEHSTLFELLPFLEQGRRWDVPLHIRLVGAAHSSPVSQDELLLAARKLKSGSPFRRVWLRADDPQQASAFTRALELHTSVHTPAPIDPNTFIAPRAGPSFHADEFGPLALVLTSAWGRVGSSTVFDAQTRYLLLRGYVVIRIFVAHSDGHFDRKRRDRALDAEMSLTHPHMRFFAQRDPARLQALQKDEVFLASSPILRRQMLFAQLRIERRAQLEKLASAAAFVIVNQLTLVSSAEGLTSAPIILETHDIRAELAELRPPPAFLASDFDSFELRSREEEAVWRHVAACVNLTREDHAKVSKHARFSVLAMPYVPTVAHAHRSAANIDLLLWGTRHNARSIEWFLDEVLPLSDSLSRCRITVVGKVAAALRRRIDAPPIVLIGFVEDIDAYFLSAKVLVVPDQYGTGLSIKMLDALSRGLCFASTEIGMRGISLETVRYTPAATARMLAEDVSSLLSSETLRQERQETARELYRANFSEQAYLRSWDTVIAHVTGPNGSSARVQAGRLGGDAERARLGPLRPSR